MLLFLFVFLLPAISAVQRLTGGPHGLFQYVNNGFGVEYCAIPKTGSTITKRILCDILLDYKGIAHRPKFSKKVVANTECQRNNNYFGRWTTKWNRPFLQTVKFSIVRDPIERFVSLYGDICENPKHKYMGCHRRSPLAFARWIYDLQKHQKAGTDKLRHILYHSWAQTRFCGIKNRDVVLVHHSHNKRKMQREFMRVFKKAHVPAHVARKALRHLIKSSTRDAGRNSAHKRQLIQQIRRNPQIMQLLRAMYFEDFKFLKRHHF